MTMIDNGQEAARYGNLVRVAIGFYVATGNPAELDAAVCYARGAAYFANRQMSASPEPVFDYASSETVHGHTVGYDFSVRVF